MTNQEKISKKNLVASQGKSTTTYKILQVPCFLDKRAFYHLWNSPNFHDFFQQNIYSFFKTNLKDDLVLVNIGEFLLGNADHWNWNIGPRLNFLFQMNETDKKLTYLKSSFYDEKTLEIKTKWLIGHQNIFLIEYLKFKGFVQYEDEHLCVLYLAN